MKVLALTYWSYNEPLIQAATLPYLRMIREVSGEDTEIHLLTLEKSDIALTGSALDQTRMMLQGRGIHLHTFDYQPFGFKAIWRWIWNFRKLVRLCRQEQFDMIHAFASPIGVIAQRLSRKTGIPFIIDSYEPHAESMVENGSWKPGSRPARLLLKSEKKQSEEAFAVLATTAGMWDYAIRTYGAVPQRFVVRPACVDLEQFNPESVRPAHNREVLTGVYAGKLGGIYLKEEIFQFLGEVNRLNDKAFHMIFLTDALPGDVMLLATSNGLKREQVTIKKVPHEEVAGHLATADFAINPVRPVPSKRFCTSIKDGEYWAMGLPVVIPAEISDDSDLIEAMNAGVVLEGIDHPALKQGALRLMELLEAEPKEARQQRIRQLAVQHRSMEVARQAYEQVYGVQGWVHRPEKRFAAVIYNALKDPLFENLVLRYLEEQVKRDDSLAFDVLTYESSKYAVNSDEFNTIRGELWDRGIRWRPLTYHTGRFMLLKKVWDFTAAWRMIRRLKHTYGLNGLIAFANTSAAITTVISRSLKLPMVIYSYEPHCEFLVDFGIWKKSGLRYKLLSRLERKAGQRAKVVMTGTRHLVETFGPKTEAMVLRAPSAVDHETFQFREEDRRSIRGRLVINDRRVFIYAGKFGGLYYEQELFSSFKAIQEAIPDAFLMILTPHDHFEVEAWLEMAGIEPADYFLGEARSAPEMAAYYAAADFGVSTIPPLPNQKYRSPVKVGEYLLCGLPYITCQGVSEDDEVARNYQVGVVLDELSPEVIQKATDKIRALLYEPRTELRKRCRETGMEYRNLETVHQAFTQAIQAMDRN